MTHVCLVWCSPVYFLWLTHQEWLQDILPSSPSTTFIPLAFDSHIPHGDISFSLETIQFLEDRTGYETSWWERGTFSSFYPQLSESQISYLPISTQKDVKTFIQLIPFLSASGKRLEWSSIIFANIESLKPKSSGQWSVPVHGTVDTEPQRK